MNATKDKPLKLLLVEDNPTDVLLLREALSQAGTAQFELNHVERLSKALERLGKEAFDVVLLDLSLTDSQGLDTFINVHAHAAEVPVVILTGLDDQELAFRAVRDGAQDYLAKGQVDSNLLKRTILYAVNQQQLRKKLDQRIEEARSSETRLRHIIEKSADGIIIVNQNGIVRFVNPAAEALLGRRAEDLLGGLFGFPVVSDEIAELDIVRRGGETAAAEARVVETEWEGERVYLASLRDVTERKQAEQALDQYAQELARSNTELEQFAYVASHDLQEPLRMVSSYLQLLERRYKGKLDSDASEFIEFAVDGASRMKVLINDLLNYSRVTSRGESLEPMNCNDALEIALSNLEKRVAETDARISHGSLPAILGDQSQIIRLFQNLVGNAIKFKGEVTPDIRISARRIDESTSLSGPNGQQRDFHGNDGEGSTPNAIDRHSGSPSWLFSVEDNGIGLDSEYADRIFAIFQRLHRQEDYEGTGIGLAICRKIVERHGGSIWVNSTPGKGSTFFFTLPISIESSSEPSPESIAANSTQRNSPVEGEPALIA